MKHDRHIHYCVNPTPDGVPFLFVIQYHYDCEVIVVTSVTIHPIGDDGILGPNLCMPDQVITNDIYNHAISMLNDDGLC